MALAPRLLVCQRRVRQEAATELAAVEVGHGGPLEFLLDDVVVPIAVAEPTQHIAVVRGGARVRVAAARAVREWLAERLAGRLQPRPPVVGQQFPLSGAEF